jgi:hypothetical protein
MWTGIDEEIRRAGEEAAMNDHDEDSEEQDE